VNGLSERIALYYDDASGERYEEKAFKKLGRPYTKIGPEKVTLQDLRSFDVVFIPGAFPLKRHGKGGFRPFLRFLRRLVENYGETFIEYLEGGGRMVFVCASVGVLGRSLRFPYFHSSLGVRTLSLFDFYAVYGPKIGTVDLTAVGYRNGRSKKVVEGLLGKYARMDYFTTLYFRGPAMFYGKRRVIRHPSSEGSGEELMVATYLDKHPRLYKEGAIAYRRVGGGEVVACSVHPEFSTWDLFESMIKYLSSGETDAA